MPTPVKFRNWAAEPPGTVFTTVQPITGGASAPPAALNYLVQAVELPMQVMVQYCGCARLFDALSTGATSREIGAPVPPAAVYGYAALCRNVGSGSGAQEPAVLANGLTGVDPLSVPSAGKGAEAWLDAPALQETSPIANDSPEFTLDRALPLVTALVPDVDAVSLTHVGAFGLIVHEHAPDLEAL